MNKTALLAFLKKLLDDRLIAIKTEMTAVQESAHNETKSSAGDKYETARAMAQNERDFLAKQYEKIRQERLLLERASPNVPSEIGFGTLIEASNGYFFVSVGLGAITFDDREVLVVSAQTPIASQLLGKKVGDTFSFRGEKHRIQVIF